MKVDRTQDGYFTSVESKSVNSSPETVRILTLQFHKTRMCPFFSRGHCRKGTGCTYAREFSRLLKSLSLDASTELKLAPDLYKTKLCEKWQAGQCASQQCRFAHGRHELRFTDHVYKTRICHFWYTGDCNKGRLCRHAHGLDELQAGIIGSIKENISSLTTTSIPISSSYSFSSPTLPVTSSSKLSQQCQTMPGNQRSNDVKKIDNDDKTPITAKSSERETDDLLSQVFNSLSARPYLSPRHQPTSCSFNKASSSLLSESSLRTQVRELSLPSSPRHTSRPFSLTQHSCSCDWLPSSSSSSSSSPLSSPALSEKESKDELSMDSASDLRKQALNFQTPSSSLGHDDHLALEDKWLTSEQQTLPNSHDTKLHSADGLTPQLRELMNSLSEFKFDLSNASPQATSDASSLWQDVFQQLVHESSNSSFRGLL